MCIECYEDFGRPVVHNELTAALTQKINDLYAMPSGVCGGGLHIVLEDFNIETDGITWCVENSIPKHTTDTDPTQIQLELEISNLMLGASEDERASALWHSTAYDHYR